MQNGRTDDIIFQAGINSTFLIVNFPKLRINWIQLINLISLLQLRQLIKQDAQLSQRDRAAGCVIVFAESRTLELRDNDLRTL